MTPLPILTDPVIIDGWTQPGFAGTPLVEIDGILAGSGAHGNGFQSSASFVVIRGLVINRFTEHGVYLQSCEEGVIEGCYIGTDPSGSLSRPNGGHGVLVTDSHSLIIGGTEGHSGNVLSGNSWGGVELAGSSSGVHVSGNYIGVNASGSHAVSNGRHGVGLSGNASGNTIGGLSESARNLISGNGQRGVYIRDSAAGNLVAGNYIGTDASGTIGIGNGLEGVLLSGYASANTVGAPTVVGRNIVAASALSGIGINSYASGNIICGNYVGTDRTGTKELGSGWDGILLAGNCSNNIIGGPDAAYGNVVAASTRGGVSLAQSTTNTVIQGNLIGTDATGNAPLGNHMFGVWIGNSSSGNAVGGPSPGSGNTISANLMDGVSIEATSYQNTVLGNYIGTNEAGASHLGNHAHGVRIIDSSSDNAVGMRGATCPNIIAHNWGAGVSISGGVRNLVASNSIHSNGGLGIDLGQVGVTPNDPGDSDTGPNMLQNFPILTSVVCSDGVTHIGGALNSVPNRTYVVECFWSPECDPSLHGEGEHCIGHGTATTDTDGNATFAFSFPVFVPYGSYVSATATDPWGNTSEFGPSDFSVPVEISCFTASLVEEGILLEWTAHSETENAGFHIFRSTGGPPIETRITERLIIGAGNSVVPRSYSYLDTETLPGTSYTYRLVAVDLSAIESACGSVGISTLPLSHELRRSRPSPFSGETTVELLMGSQECVQLAVYNLGGRLVRMIHRGDLQAGFHSFVWDGLDDCAASVPSGIYLWVARIGSKEFTQEVIFTR